MNKDTAIGIAARVWCDQDFETYVMDGDACEEIADIVLFVANKQERQKAKELEFGTGED